MRCIKTEYWSGKVCWVEKGPKKHMMLLLMPSIDSNRQGPGVRWSPTSFSTGRELCHFVMWTGTVAPLRTGGKMLPDRKQRNGRRIRFLLTSLFTCWHQTYESLMIKQSKSNKHVLQPFQFFVCLWFGRIDFGFWSLDFGNSCAWPKTRGDKRRAWALKATDLDMPWDIMTDSGDIPFQTPDPRQHFSVKV